MEAVFVSEDTTGRDGDDAKGAGEDPNLDGDRVGDP